MDEARRMTGLGLAEAPAKFTNRVAFDMEKIPFDIKWMISHDQNQINYTREKPMKLLIIFIIIITSIFVV